MTAEAFHLATAAAAALGWTCSRHPAWFVPLLTAISLLAGEFYPLSDYPMYSDPDERENYLYLARVVDDDAYEPLPVRTLTGVTAPKVKKMYRSRLRSRIEAGARRPSMADRSSAGADLLAFLRGQARSRGAVLPSRIALIEVWIVHDGVRGYHERMQVVAIDGPESA